MKTIKILPAISNKSAFLKITFILFCAAFTSTVLLFYSFLLRPLVPHSNIIREYCICFGQILFQGLLLFSFKFKKQLFLDYLSQMMTVSFFGGLLLLPVLISTLIFFPFSPGPYFYLAYFFMIVLFMFFDHKKRVKKIHAPAWLTFTWILYRLFVLIIIL